MDIVYNIIDMVLRKIQQKERKENMNKEWSEKNAEIQKLLGRKDTYKEGIEKLIEFRAELFTQITNTVNDFPEIAFSQIPFAGATGYHRKTLAYSIWHIFRIEDIVAHEMIAEDEQILFAGKYNERIGTKVITTGNEIADGELENFSRELKVSVLYEYAEAVMKSTNDILKNLDYADFKRKFGEEDKNKLAATGCVSTSESAVWLIDYWCGKNVLGLIKMPFSRHWIMHIEAMQRIKNKLCKLEKS